jgi:hypothetical protein
MLVFSIFFARLVMTCLYGNAYGNSTIYFQIKNISSLLYIIPFAPVILAIGKTRRFANVHLVIAILVVALEYAVVKIGLGPVAIAIVSEICKAVKIYLLFRIVADYSGMPMASLIPVRQLLTILLASLVAGGLAALGIGLLEMNKWLLLGTALVVFVALYYGLCRVMKISYRSIFIGIFPRLENSTLYNLIP